MRELVQNGQFGIMGGGWVMHDEALPDYRDMLVQIEVGQRWLRDTFNIKPRVGWQIDPFGHSSVTPFVFSELGYEAIVLS